MTWSLHVSERLKKANRALYLLRRNVSPKVNVSVKLGLYKSILLPILLYGMNCVRLSRGSTRDLESFQKRAFNWVCYESNWSYLQPLRLLNLLQLPLFMQCNDIVLMSKLLVEGEHNINIPTCNPEAGRSTMFFKLNKCKKEKTRGEFVYRTCRIVNRINEKIQFANPLGLKSRIVGLMWSLSTTDSLIPTLAHGNYVATAVTVATFGHRSNQKLWEKSLWCQTPGSHNNNNNNNNRKKTAQSQRNSVNRRSQLKIGQHIFPLKQKTQYNKT